MINKDFCTETKVVGVTKNNDKGMPIQSLLPSLKEGDRIILIRDYGNEYDENAIKIYNRDGNHIGYLSASLAENISPFLEENPKYDIEGVVRCITGGTEGKSYGCNITIWIQDPDEPSYEELHAFAKNYTPEKETAYGYVVSKKSDRSMWIVAALICTVILFILIAVFNAFVSNLMSKSGEVGGVDCVYDSSNISATMSSEPAKESIQGNSSYTSSGKDNHWLEANTSSYEISSSTSSINQSNTSQSTSTSVDTSSSIFSASEDEVPVKVTDIDLTMKILPPNSIGTIWMEATYTNNSNYAISSVSYKYLCRDTNETHYLSAYDTVLPGETSPIFDGFGPESGKEGDIEFLVCQIVVIDENDEKIFIDYDYKLGTYEMI